jgi:hypothetical protein
LPLAYVLILLNYDYPDYEIVSQLTTNGIVVTDAIKYIQGKMDHLNKTEKALLQDIKDDKDKIQPEQDKEEQATTTNGVF